jgi:hypothetical protein
MIPRYLMTVYCLSGAALIGLFFVEKDANCGVLILEMRSLLAKRRKESNFLEENTHRLRSPSQKSRKGWIPKKLVSK